MKIDMEQDHFDEMTKYMGQKARWYALDAMACVFHNEGHFLAGNTEKSDVTWFADFLCRRLYDMPLDRVGEEGRAELVKLAQAALEALPYLADRIANRYITVSKAIRTSERIARQQVEQMRKKVRK